MKRTISIYARPRLPGIVCVREGLYPPGWVNPSHFHQFLQLLLVRDGQAVMETANTQLTLDRGDLLVLPPNHPHGWRSSGRHDLQFFDLCVEAGFDEGRLWQGLSYHYSGRELLVLRSSPRLLIAAEAIGQAIAKPAPGQDYRVYGRILDYLGAILQLAAQELTTPDDPVHRVEAEIAVRFAEPLTLEQMAGWVGVGAKQLCRLFQRAGRESPMAVVTARRLEAACELLADTHLPISRVAASCGYEDAQYFSRLFRRHLGATPRQYRRDTTGE